MTGGCDICGYPMVSRMHACMHVCLCGGDPYAITTAARRIPSTILGSGILTLGEGRKEGVLWN